MTTFCTFSLVLAPIWGVLWAGFLWFIPFGRKLRRQYTWLAVIVGVGIDLALALGCVSWRYLWYVVAIIALSGVPVVIFCLATDPDVELSDDERRIVNKRIANNVINALGDIVALCNECRALCRQGITTSGVKNDSANVLAWAQTLDSVTIIERKALRAQDGEYA